MKIAVVGAGAMGSIYAGLLASSGNEVWAIDLWQEHIQAIRQQGLRVEGASGDRTVSVNATTDFSEPGICELVILATKASGVESATQAMGPLLDDNSVILTIQNGLGAAERISEFRSPDNILIGVAGGFGASMKGPGHAHHNGMELIRLGEMAGGITERLTRVEEVWRDAGFNVKSFTDIEQLVWEKFVCNVTFSGPCTVFGKTTGEVMANDEMWSVAQRCGLEAYAAGVAKGVNFSFNDAAAYIHKFGSSMPHARPSMLQDHVARRPSEIDAINGMVPVVAKQVGIQAPANEIITAIIHGLESSY